MTQVQCKFCGYVNRTKNKLWFKCKWCGKKSRVKENDNGKS